MCLAGLSHSVWPDAALDLSDVSLAQQEHTQAALSDATADALRKLPGKQSAMEIEFGPLALISDLELSLKCFGVYTDTH